MSPFNRKNRHWLLQLTIFLIISLVAWKMLHYQPATPKDVYPYLTSIPPSYVLKCQKEGQEFAPDTWAKLLAVRTSINESEAKEVIKQLLVQNSFANINWGKIPQEKAKIISYRYNILIKYPFFEISKYTFPVAGKTWYDNNYGADREGGKRKHEGIDLFSEEGTPIVNVYPGSIEQLGWNRLGGERVGVRGEDGNYYYYAHLAKIAPSLRIGLKIKQGDPIGTMGHTGDAITTPDHLHFGIELPNGTWINPYNFLVVWQAFSQH